MVQRGRVLVLAALASLCCAQPAAAQPPSELSAHVSPEQLGRPTSISLNMNFSTEPEVLPAPLKRLAVRYPNNLGIAISGLGIETCSAAILEARGPTGCPIDSVMGYGSALGEIPFGPEVIKEWAKLTVVRAADINGHIALLFDAQGLSPVVANIVLSGVLVPARPPYGGVIGVEVPLVPSLPEAPDVAVVKIIATLGPAAGLVYTEHVGGKTVSYRPKGILLPSHCPRGGFSFADTATFVDGTSSSAHTRVPCPTRARGRHG
jgi:hypothetical protein